MYILSVWQFSFEIIIMQTFWKIVFKYFWLHMKIHFHNDMMMTKHRYGKSSTRCSHQKTRINDLVRDKQIEEVRRKEGREIEQWRQLFTSVGICLCRFFQLVRFANAICMWCGINRYFFSLPIFLHSVLWQLRLTHIKLNENDWAIDNQSILCRWFVVGGVEWKKKNGKNDFIDLSQFSA